jgi:hypothetical protein
MGQFYVKTKYRSVVWYFMLLSMCVCFFGLVRFDKSFTAFLVCKKVHHDWDDYFEGGSRIAFA